MAAVKDERWWQQSEAEELLLYDTFRPQHMLHISGQGFLVLNLSGSVRLNILPQPLVQVTKQALLVLQTVTWNYSREVDYRTYRLADYSFCYDETVSSYTSKIVKKVKS